MKCSHAIVILCCFAAIFTACKKNGDNTKSGHSPTEALLLNGKWQLTASVATINYNGKDTSQDLYTDKEACAKDDFITFSDNGMVTVDEGATRCPGHDQTASFPWALLDNDTRLALVDQNPDTVNLELTSSEMKFKITKKNSSGTPVHFTETYKNIK